MSKKRRETPEQLAARVAKSAATRRERRGRAITADEVVAYLEPVALREQILKDGLALTMGSRNQAYGDPFINFMLTARLKELFWNAMEASGKSVQQNSPFGHSIDMVFTNLARIATSPTTHLERDRYLDGANYMAIAYEVGCRGEK